MYIDLFFPNRFRVTESFLYPNDRFTYSLGYTTLGMQKAYSMVFDADGIIMMSHYVDDPNSGGHYYSPVKIAHYALAAYNDYVMEGDEAFLKKFNSHIDYLKKTWRNLNEDVNSIIWVTPSSNPKYNISYNYKSSIVQGLVISSLVRAYVLNQDQEALELGIKAANILEIEVENGGLLAKSQWGDMYEEYPCEPYSHVINGFMFCLIGLYDLFLVTRNDRIKTLFDKGINSLLNVIDDWILPYWSKYDLWDITCHKKVNLATRHYHYLHIDQLDILHKMTDNIKFLETKERLERQLISPISFLIVYFNKFEKLILKK